MKRWNAEDNDWQIDKYRVSHNMWDPHICQQLEKYNTNWCNFLDLRS